MTEHQGLPVQGYKPQADDSVRLVNANKETEERLLRQCEGLIDNHEMNGCDPRAAAIAKTSLQDAFMWLNRAIFNPSRVTLPEDAQTENETPADFKGEEGPDKPDAGNEDPDNPGA